MTSVTSPSSRPHHPPSRPPPHPTHYPPTPPYPLPPTPTSSRTQPNSHNNNHHPTKIIIQTANFHFLEYCPITQSLSDYCYLLFSPIHQVVAIFSPFSDCCYFLLFLILLSLPLPSCYSSSSLRLFFPSPL